MSAHESCMRVDSAEIPGFDQVLRHFDCHTFGLIDNQTGGEWWMVETRVASRKLLISGETGAYRVCGCFGVLLSCSPCDRGCQSPRQLADKNRIDTTGLL